MKSTIGLTAMIIFLALGCWGCGGGSAVAEGDDGAGGVAFELEGGAHSGGQFVITYADVGKDNYDSGTGGGSGTVGGITDTAGVTCDFSLVDLETSSGIEIVADALTCANANKCIACTLAADDEAGSCTISCAGTVPSNEEARLDSFRIGLTYAVAFTTTMVGEGGFRLDGDVTNWSIFDPSDGTNGLNKANIIATACNGTDSADADPVSSGVDSFNGGVWTDDLDADSFSIAYILDPATGSNCTLNISMTGVVPLSGAASGTPISFVDGNIAINATICDDTGYCPEASE